VFCRKCGVNIPEDSQFCVNCGVAVIAPSPPTASGTGAATGDIPALEPNILSSASGKAIEVPIIPATESLPYRSRTKVIEKFALLSVAALFFIGYLIFSFAPSKGFNFQYTPVSLIGFAIGLALVLLPSILAAYSDHPKFVWVMLVNIFFSWTIIFWVVALIWSLSGWKDRHTIARQGLSARSELSASSRFRDVLRIDLSGRWYLRLLKVCIAVIGAFLLVLLIFFLYGLVKGALGAIH